MNVLSLTILPHLKAPNTLVRLICYIILKIDYLSMVHRKYATNMNHRHSLKFKAFTELLTDSPISI